MCSGTVFEIIRKEFARIFQAALAAIAGFGEGTPQQVSREGQNRRIADFGTVVETCSKTAADCPCLVFPYIERTERGLRPAVDGLFPFANMTPERGFAARWLRLFPFPLKIHFKGRQLPAGRGFFKISFASVMRERGFWQPAGREFFLSLPTPPRFEICQTEQAVFSGFTCLLRVICDFAKWTTKKAANLFQTYCFRWPPVAADIQF